MHMQHIVWPSDCVFQQTMQFLFELGTNKSANKNEN